MATALTALATAGKAVLAEAVEQEELLAVVPRVMAAAMVATADTMARRGGEPG